MLKLTKEDIHTFHTEWLNNKETSKSLRFGQYVFYYTSYEYKHSYDEVDAGKALQLLLEGIAKT